MVKVLKVLLVVALTAVLVVGLTINVCCNGVDANGNPNGDVPNGDVPNGDVPNGSNSLPDLISGFGYVIDSDEYNGTGPQPGDPAPDFRFQDANGQTFSLSDLRGKAVFLNFWKTTCGYCIQEMPYIEQVYEEWLGGDVVFLTIDMGEYDDTVSDLLDDLDFSIPVILDIEAEVTVQYRVSSIPRTFFIDKDGLIRGIMFGPFQSAEQIEDALNQLINL
jgi:thiol-disulfide isomerase/thioredoxin